MFAVMSESAQYTHVAACRFRNRNLAIKTDGELLEKTAANSQTLLPAKFYDSRSKGCTIQILIDRQQSDPVIIIVPLFIKKEGTLKNTESVNTNLGIC